MKKSYLLILFCLSLVMSCTQQKNKKLSDNPLLNDFDTPFGVPPFEKIKSKHYLPAFKEGITQQNKEINAIIENSDSPDFENTIEAYEYSGSLLSKVAMVFYNIHSSNTNDTIQKLAQEISPMLSQHDDSINMNPKLFKRVKEVYEQKNKLDLNAEQKQLLEVTYRNFVRSGALLDETQQKRMKEINKELSELTLKFGDNILAEVNNFKLIIDKKKDLAGLPQGLTDASAQAAKEAKLEGKWLFTIRTPSITPFLENSEKRDLREKIYKAYINKGNNNDKYDNKEIIEKIVTLRLERANMLGYKTHADYVLDENMAKNPVNVSNLLMKLWQPAINVAKNEVSEMSAIIKKENGRFKLAAWDWRFYAEKLRKEKYNLNEEELRPYFALENVKNGAFTVANNLYGITFNEIKDIPKFNSEATAYEVKDADGKFLGVLYMDFFPRASKKSGAWASSYRRQHMENGKDIRPICGLNCNFTKPTKDKPALLTLDEVVTLFHEFGHTLHSLLSKCTYVDLSGSSVPRDFVELPSQIMENWALEPQVLKMYAKHYKTGQPITDELINKIKNSKLFNQGFITVEYLAASILDMDFHTVTKPFDECPMKFQKEKMKAIGLIPEIDPRYSCTYFNHIFSGGYSSGYYSYIWAEIISTDAFELFKQKGLFDKKTAESFRKNILEKGYTEEPMILYKKFRGAEPDITPLLKSRGLDKVK